MGSRLTMEQKRAAPLAIYHRHIAHQEEKQNPCAGCFDVDVDTASSTSVTAVALDSPCHVNISEQNKAAFMQLSLAQIFKFRHMKLVGK
jgi:hypothetical protein